MKIAPNTGICMIEIDKSLSVGKRELLTYFRERTAESLEEIRRTYGSREFKKQATAVNRAIIKTSQSLGKTLLQKATREKWNNNDILRCLLMVTHASNVVKIESRNDVWPYEYMAFSRRIGELWEPFCKLCFDYPSRELTLFVPPLFSEVKQKFTDEIEDYIDILTITEEQKKELKRYYSKVWSFVASGEVKLELDLHFEQDGERFIVDFKSGFGSNEKGNTNRLLLVATIYKNLEENYRCCLFVRAAEDRNNNYFQRLKNSSIWEAYCGSETYAKIKEYSGFDAEDWIQQNIDWASDFRSDTMKFFADNDLEQYLRW